MTYPKGPTERSDAHPATKSAPVAAKQPAAAQPLDPGSLLAPGLNTVAAVLVIIGSVIAAMAEPASEITTSVFGPSATLLSLDARAFWIWWPIVVGLLAFIVWVWLPANHASERMASLYWPGLVAGVAHLAWIIVARQGLVIPAAIILVFEITALCLLVWRLAKHRSSGPGENLATDIGWGLVLGFVSVQALVLVAVVVEAFDLAEDRLYLIIAMIACGVLLAGALGMAGRLFRQFAVGAAVVWGFTWLGLERIVGEPRNYLLGGMALVCAGLVLLAFIASGMRKRKNIFGLGRSWD